MSALGLFSVCSISVSLRESEMVMRLTAKRTSPTQCARYVLELAVLFRADVSTVLGIDFLSHIAKVSAVSAALQCCRSCLRGYAASSGVSSAREHTKTRCKTVTHSPNSMEATTPLTAQCKKMLTPNIRLFSICLISLFWRTNGMVIRATAKITSIAQCPLYLSKLIALFHENLCLLNCWVFVS
uniref:Uncharacterized protein n=1 Tax=Ixodes ricinus TaxID=34613 RepID=A0A6B0UZF8_IXORI